MTRIIDITLSISPDMPVWPGDPAVSMELIQSISAGDMANVTDLHFGAHTGTHIDAAHHFVNGARKVDEIPLEILIGRAQVMAFGPEVEEIGRKELEAQEWLPGIRRVLFRTRNSNHWAEGYDQFDTGFVSVSKAGAQFLVEKGVFLVGIDYLSVASYADPAPTHRTLLENDVVVLEGLDLSQVQPGEYTLLCLPLKLKGAEGAPMRAALLDGELPA